MISQREISFYRAMDFIPLKDYTLEDAQKAIEIAQKFIDISEKLIL